MSGSASFLSSLLDGQNGFLTSASTKIGVHQHPHVVNPLDLNFSQSSASASGGPILRHQLERRYDDFLGLGARPTSLHHQGHRSRTVVTSFVSAFEEEKRMGRVKSMVSHLKGTFKVWERAKRAITENWEKLSGEDGSESKV